MTDLARLRALMRSIAVAGLVLAFASMAGRAHAAGSPYGPATPADAAEQLLDFAERGYPQFFPTREPTQAIDKYRYRYYPSLGTYLGVAINAVPGDGLVEGGVYVLGGSFGSVPALVGVLNQFITPVASPLVRITLELRASAPRWPGPVYLRAGTAAITRADMTRQDANCSPTGPGNLSCTIGVLRGQTVTLVANDQQAQIQFFSTPYANREADPRGIRSQFDSFGAPCAATSERGVCSFTALTNQTIAVAYKPLKWTRMNFIGVVEWNVIVDAPPNLNIGSDLSTVNQAIHVFSRLTPGLAECITGDVPVPCYDIISPNEATFFFQALPPFGPTPLGSSGPLQFVGFDNACGSDNICSLAGSFDQITMKWQYYKCPTGASNPRFNLGVKYFDCVLVTPG